MADQKQTARVPRWIKIILGLSLALNLLIIGMIVGAGARGGGPMRGGPSMSNYAMPYVKALPHSDRRAIFQQLRAAEGQGLPNRGARKAHYAEMVSTLGAETFDRAAVEAILAAQSEMSIAVLSAAQQAWLDQVAQMDAKTRQAYAVRIKEGLERKRPHKKKGNVNGAGS